LEMTAGIVHGAQLRVVVTDPSSVGECRRSAKRMAEAYGFDEATTGRISIVATELASNMQRHAGSGTFLAQVLDDGRRPLLEMLAIDKGRGMPDVDHCMRDGYSSAGTAGIGLGSIARQSTVFDLFSTPGKGTVVMSRIAGRDSKGRAAAPPRSVELGAICVALQGEIECGDAWRVAYDDAAVSMMIADGLGHGPLAAVASKAAAAAFEQKPFDLPAAAMGVFHRALSGSRGAAAACALLHSERRVIEYAGVGNICGCVVSADRGRGMVSHSGTLGTNLLRTQQFEYAWPEGSPVVMHSDGLSARWNLADYPGLMQRHSAVIAGVLFRDFSRPSDDATVLVARQRP
jgi:anti-sigma regulatory factor (Ser/Thr protein kinase)